MGESENQNDENIWGAIGDVLEWVMETEVSLGVVLLLLLIGGFREGISWWFKRRGGHE